MNNNNPYSKFTFINESNYPGQDGHKISFETDAVTLSGVTEAFTAFLKGCGYQLDSLEIHVTKVGEYDDTDDMEFVTDSFNYTTPQTSTGYYDEYGTYHPNDDGE